MISKEEILSLQSFSSEEEYRQSSSLNYSLIKELQNGPRALIEESRDKSSSAFDVGTFVDKHFTDKENLYNIYSIDKRKIVLTPSLETLYDHFAKRGEWNPTDEEIISACRSIGLFEKMVDEAKILAKIDDNFRNKLKNTRDTIGKKLLSEEEYLKSMYSIENIENDPTAMELITEHDGEMVLNQFKIEFPIKLESGNVRKFRVMIDITKINFNTMQIYGTDVKTGKRNSWNFYDQFIEYRYDIQGMLYYWGLLALRRLINERFGIELISPSSNNFKFLYSPKIQNRMPIIVPMDDDWIRTNGGESLYYNDKVLPGCWKLMNEADWYISNGEFKNHKIISESRIHPISKLSKYAI